MTRRELKKWMAQKGWNATEVAGATLISLATISRYLNGRTAHLRPIYVRALKELMAQDLPDADPKTVL